MFSPCGVMIGWIVGPYRWASLDSNKPQCQAVHCHPTSDTVTALTSLPKLFTMAMSGSAAVWFTDISDNETKHVVEFEI